VIVTKTALFLKKIRENFGGFLGKNRYIALFFTTVAFISLVMFPVAALPGNVQQASMLVTLPGKSATGCRAGVLSFIVPGGARSFFCRY